MLSHTLSSITECEWITQETWVCLKILYPKCDGSSQFSQFAPWLKLVVYIFRRQHLQVGKCRKPPVEPNARDFPGCRAPNFDTQQTKTTRNDINKYSIVTSKKIETCEINISNILETCLYLLGVAIPGKPRRVNPKISSSCLSLNHKLWFISYHSE